MKDKKWAEGPVAVARENQLSLLIFCLILFFLKDLGAPLFFEATVLVQN